MFASCVRTMVVYLVLIAAVRLMGKRQIGQLEASEFVVTMLAANLATLPIEDPDFPLSTGLASILTVLALELVLSLVSMRSIWFRKLLCGKPVILIENGRILQDNLRSTRITLDELTGHLREKDVLDVTAVQYAILETNGNLSVFPFPKFLPASAKDAGICPKKQHLPITIIGDGYLYRENLTAAGKDEKWVEKYLREQALALSQVWLLTLDGAGKTVLLKKENG